MNNKFKILAIKQGTQEWYEWRRMGIGASDAPIIIGDNRFSNIDSLIKQKTDPFYIEYENEYMKKGKILEPQARNIYIQRTGKIVYPACIESVEYDWLKASLDGLNTDYSLVIEIKCGKKAYEHASLYKRIPDYYYAQAQHILAITEYDYIDFWFYWPGMQEILIKVKKDDKYIKRLLEKEYQFWNRIKNNIRPKHFYYQEMSKENNYQIERMKTDNEVRKDIKTNGTETSKANEKVYSFDKIGCLIWIIFIIILYILGKLVR